jgi:hypothetical protein
MDPVEAYMHFLWVNLGFVQQQHPSAQRVHLFDASQEEGSVQPSIGVFYFSCSLHTASLALLTVYSTCVDPSTTVCCGCVVLSATGGKVPAATAGP